MTDKVIIALDAMGGDYAPVETVHGAVDAVAEHPEKKVLLVGKQDEIEKELQKYSYNKENREVVNATEIIEMGEVPTKAIREKNAAFAFFRVKLELLRRCTQWCSVDFRSSFHMPSCPICVSISLKIPSILCTSSSLPSS